MSVEDQVARHYGVEGLADLILQALGEGEAGGERVEPQALAPIDEFHIGGRPATEHFADLLRFSAGGRILDVGCGLGGAARFFSERFDCHVVGLDLTSEYIEVARLLSERTGLEDATKFDVGSACDMPYEDAHFDGAITIHVAMNVPDREALYREVARVLKPGALFGIYDVMRGSGDGLGYPVPWAESAETSHLTTPDEMRTLLTEAGFDVLEFEDRTKFGIEFFRQMKARVAVSGPQPLGLHILMGESFSSKIANMIRGLEEGHVMPAVMTARRAAASGEDI